MGMDKRDICFAHCCTYLLAWLIRDAPMERYKYMKDLLRRIHQQLDVEDVATSEAEPEPKWRRLFDHKLRE